LVEIRRDIHRHPELGLQETRTAALIADELNKLGLEVQTGVGVTGVVGLLRGNTGGKTVLLRADIDCLAMNEMNETEYASEYPGRMHACGHDAHTTWLLGTAMILSQMKDKVKGNVKFVFQPAEEGPGGAERMIAEGVLQNPTVDYAFGAHVWPTVETGKIAIKDGPMMAAPDKFNLRINGRGGHASQPEVTIDPISIAVQVYNSLQTIVSRRVSPLDAVVVSITMFNGGTAHNIIPDYVDMTGSVRSLLPETREKLPIMIEEIIKGIVEANHGTYSYDYQPYYPPLINHAEANVYVKAATSMLLGEDALVELDKPVMGGEDFSYFIQEVPGTFYFIGTRNEEKGIVHGLHHPRFDIDEDVLSKASAVMAQTAILYLEQNS
jgi:amidohydrolase